VALEESRGESAQTIVDVLKRSVPDRFKHQVVNVSTDVANAKVYTELKAVFPNLTYLSLDPMHLCFMVDRHTKKRGIRPTVVGLVMRNIMRKFSMTSKEDMGESFIGGLSNRLTQQENDAVNHIKNGDIPMAKAKAILQGMNPNVPMQSLEEFATLLAAVVRVYPERVDTTFDKTTMRASLVHAASRSRFGWYYTVRNR